MGAKLNPGCKWATEYLGRQSHCILLGDINAEGKRIVLDQCPFPKCIEDIIGSEKRSAYLRAFKKESVRAEKNKDILKMYREGKSVRVIAREYGMCHRDICKVV